MSEFQASNFKKENGGAPDLAGMTELTSPYFFVPPSGDTASRPQSCAAGTLRFNTDIGTLEVYRGDGIGWVQIQRRENQYLGGGTGSAGGTGTRALTLGGYTTPTNVNTINYLTIEVLGNAQDFGDLAKAEQSQGSIADNTRMLSIGGDSAHPGHTNVIEKITISSTGNGSDFGDASTACARHPYSGGNKTRGVYGGGGTPSNTDQLEYITIQSEGNGVDFGNTVRSGQFRRGNAGSTTRGVIMGNYNPADPNKDGHSNLNYIEFITFATAGNALDFGDLTGTLSDATSTSNCIRALRIGKWPTADVCDYVTIATLGDAIDFGDMNVAAYHTAAASNPTRAVKLGGNEASGQTNACEFFTIMTTGNGQDFGDLAYIARGLSANSNGHGGL